MQLQDTGVRDLFALIRELRDAAPTLRRRSKSRVEEWGDAPECDGASDGDQSSGKGGSPSPTNTGSSKVSKGSTTSLEASPPGNSVKKRLSMTPVGSPPKASPKSSSSKKTSPKSMKKGLKVNKTAVGKGSTKKKKGSPKGESPNPKSKPYDGSPEKWENYVSPAKGSESPKSLDPHASSSGRSGPRKALDLELHQIKELEEKLKA